MNIWILPCDWNITALKISLKKSVLIQCVKMDIAVFIML